MTTWPSSPPWVVPTLVAKYTVAGVPKPVTATKFTPQLINELRMWIERILGYYRLNLSQIGDTWRNLPAISDGKGNLTWTDSVPLPIPAEFRVRPYVGAQDDEWLCLNPGNKGCPSFFGGDNADGPCIYYDGTSGVKTCWTIATQSTIPKAFLLKATYFTQLYDALDFLVATLGAAIVPLWRGQLFQWVVPQWDTNGAKLPGAAFTSDVALKVKHVQEARRVLFELIARGIGLLANAALVVKSSVKDYSLLATDAGVKLAALLKDTGFSDDAVIRLFNVVNDRGSPADSAVSILSVVEDEALQQAISPVKFLKLLQSLAYLTADTLTELKTLIKSGEIAPSEVILRVSSYLKSSSLMSDLTSLDVKLGLQAGSYAAEDVAVNLLTVVSDPVLAEAVARIRTLSALLYRAQLPADAVIKISNTVSAYVGLPVDARLAVETTLLSLRIQAAELAVRIHTALASGRYTGESSLRVLSKLETIPEGLGEAKLALKALLADDEIFSADVETEVKSLVADAASLYSAITKVTVSTLSEAHTLLQEDVRPKVKKLLAATQTLASSTTIQVKNLIAMLQQLTVDAEAVLTLKAGLETLDLADADSAVKVLDKLLTITELPENVLLAVRTGLANDEILTYDVRNAVKNSLVGGDRLCSEIHAPQKDFLLRITEEPAIELVNRGIIVWKVVPGSMTAYNRNGQFQWTVDEVGFYGLSWTIDELFADITVNGKRL